MEYSFEKGSILISLINASELNACGMYVRARDFTFCKVTLFKEWQNIAAGNYINKSRIRV